MNNYLVMLSGLLTFLVFDYLWLGLLMKSFYQSRLELKTMVWWSALIVYVLLIIALFMFSNFNWKSGWLLGFFIYGIYNFTNYAILNWNIQVAIVDSLWGGTISAIVVFVMSYVRNL